MDRQQFFRELCTVLGREGFTTQPEQDDLLPVEWDSRPLCRITEGGGVRYWQEDVATSERNQACERATNLACMVQERFWPDIRPNMVSTLLPGTGTLTAQVLTTDATFRKTIRAPSRTSPPGPVSSRNSRYSMRRSLLKFTAAVLIPWTPDSI